MAQIILLGTGGVVTTPDRTTTMLAFCDENSTFLVDCGGDIIHRCLAAGIDPDTIDALLVSHEHPDHVAGFPLFMEKIWLHGRRRPIRVVGIESAINQAARIFECFDTSGWEGLPPIEYEKTSLDVNAPVFESDAWSVVSSPGQHTVPAVGYRVEHKQTGTTVCYSCDTEPSDEITRLASGCNVLIHEANGHSRGHASPAEAARVAADANVGELVLVHIGSIVTDDDLAAARAIFPNTRFGKELEEITL